MLYYVLGVVLFAIGICVSVALHEAGHMVTAKMFGMKVRRYFVGFGPTVFSFHRRGTEYGLKWIPFGGFCDIAGMTALDEVTPDEAPRAMYRFKTWKRTVVLAAGSFTHFILGFVVLYLMAITMGLVNTDDKALVDEVSPCVQNVATVEQANAAPQCKPGDPAPAKAAGIQQGDQVVAIGGVETPKWSDLLDKVQNASGPTEVTVLRDGQRRTLTVDIPQVERPKMDGKGTERVGVIGVSKSTMEQYGPVDGLGATLSFTGTMFSETAQRLVELPSRVPPLIDSVFGAERDPNTPVSVVGASRLGGEAVEHGIWELFFFLLATLNFFIGVFNLLPLLPLDGGHIVVAWYERVRDAIRKARGKVPGGPVDYTKLNAVTMVLVVIGGFFVLLTVTADIVNPIRFFN